MRTQKGGKRKEKERKEGKEKKRKERKKKRKRKEKEKKKKRKRKKKEKGKEKGKEKKKHRYRLASWAVSAAGYCRARSLRRAASSLRPLAPLRAEPLVLRRPRRTRAGAV